MSAPQDLAFTAMDGVFPACDDFDALWQHIRCATPGPLSSLCSRWCVAPERLLAPAGTPDTAYTDLAFALPERAPEAPLPEALGTSSNSRWGRQWSFAHHVSSRLLKGLPGQLDRSELGIVLATSWTDESMYLADAALARAWDHTVSPGFDPDAQLGALCESLGCGGAAVAVDAACSSFIYAVEVARGLIESGQARAVLIAGVNAFLPSALYIGFSQLRALSATGELAAFGAAASGIVPGEAVAAVLLERVEDAVRSGRPPLARLRAIGLSCDGREGGVFAPGREGQQRAYARALPESSNLEIDYVEAHGTGTVLGDRTELESLTAFYASRLAPGSKLPLGSVKSLMGHSLAAAGATALVKAMLMLKHRSIPSHRVASPSEALRASCFRLPESAEPWLEEGRPMRIAISSFGFGGTNAHMVIESADAHVTVGAQAEADARPYCKLDLTIHAVDAALAGCFSLADTARAFEEPARRSTFPHSRFALNGEKPGVQGCFFGDATEIDVAGFGMGPKQLAAVDSFKLLLASRVHNVASQLGCLGDARTGIVTCANLGGEVFFDCYRESAAYGAGAGARAPNITAEKVATALPNMLSGYAAMFCDAKGLHCTLSGRSDTFLTALLGAPEWLRRRCETLILAAGSYVSSRVDLLRLQRLSAGGAWFGEGASAFALRQAGGDAEQAALATLHAYVPAESAEQLAHAARLIGWSEAPHWVESCQLAPCAVPVGSIQRHTGHLREATGSEALLAALLRAQGNAAIEVREGARLRGWLLVTVHRRPPLAAAPGCRLPLRLPFSAETSEHRPASTAEARETVRRQTVSSLCSPHELRAQAPVTSLAPASPLLGRPMAREQRALHLLRPRAADAEVRALSRLRKAPQHIVLERVHHKGRGHAAELRVCEQHPFYFDHPLDHVPGILLLEGMLQLCEVALQASARTARDWFVSAVEVSFRRYAEKDQPIIIELAPSPDAPHVMDLSVRQSADLLCSATIAVRSGALGLLAARRRVEPPPPAVPLVDRRWVHKERLENVLIAPVEPEQGRGVLAARTTVLAPGHALADGDPRQLSILYFLEAGRQTLMINAHKRCGVPLGTPMNLVDLRFTLDAPLPRHEALTIRPVFELRGWNGLMMTTPFALEICAGEHCLGRGEGRAQTMAREMYELQRKPRNRAG